MWQPGLLLYVMCFQLYTSYTLFIDKSGKAANPYYINTPYSCKYFSSTLLLANLGGEENPSDLIRPTEKSVSSAERVQSSNRIKMVREHVGIRKAIRQLRNANQGRTGSLLDVLPE